MAKAPYRLAILTLGACIGVASRAAAQRSDVLGPETLKYARIATPRTILSHVRVLDGTGAPPQQDRNVTIDNGRIVAIAPGADADSAAGVTVLNARGYSVIPGIIGMHDHLWYQERPNLREDGTFDAPSQMMSMTFSAPRMYLATGVTTIRTTGSVAPYADIRLAHDVESGRLPGPHIDASGPYLDGLNSNGTLQIPQLSSADDARRTVAFWAEHGATSFKAYQHITREELKAAIDEAHKRGIKVTGHLCSVSYPEAIALGIDNLEHGFMANTQNDPDKKPDACSASGGDYTLEHMVPGSAAANELFAQIISHHVAITSTLALRAAIVPGIGNLPDGRPLRSEAVEAMSPRMRATFDAWRDHPSATRDRTATLLRNEMALERAFVRAGGLLIAGPDPVGLSGVMPGFSDQRQIELLVEAGFSPLEAIRIGTLNGALYLGRERDVGSIAVGKRADLVLVRGDPSTRIDDIENVEIVFKDGVGYDPRKLLASTKGRFGDY